MDIIILGKNGVDINLFHIFMKSLTIYFFYFFAFKWLKTYLFCSELFINQSKAKNKDDNHLYKVAKYLE